MFRIRRKNDARSYTHQKILSHQEKFTTYAPRSLHVRKLNTRESRARSGNDILSTLYARISRRFVFALSRAKERAYYCRIECRCSYFYPTSGCSTHALMYAPVPASYKLSSKNVSDGDDDGAAVAAAEMAEAANEIDLREKSDSSVIKAVSDDNELYM